MRQYFRRRLRPLSGDDDGILMGVAISLLIVICIDQAGILAFCEGALTGDEQFGRIVGGAFWVFTSQGVSIVNPETCHLDHSFSQDTTNTPLPQQWSKGVYMVRQKLVAVATEDDDIALTVTPELLPKQDAYILINAVMPTSSDKGEVIVLDTNSDSKTPVLRRIEVGGSLGNAYAVHNRNQFWTHSGADGYFYVIDLTAEIKDHTGHPIKAKIATAQDQGHLLWEIGIGDNTVIEDTLDGNFQIGYATSRSEPSLFILDMHYHKQVDRYDLSNDAKTGTCLGAASMAFSKTNQHLYIECYGPGGTLEYDVSRPAAPLFITQHVTVGGSLYETPDQVYVTATDKGANRINFFFPFQTGQPSTAPIQIKVQGHPEPPVFYDDTNTLDFIACMPLTENLNRVHRNDNVTSNNNNASAWEEETVVCDYFNGCQGARTEVDSDHGKCLYDSTRPTQLLLATQDQLQQVQNQQDPFGGACGLCNLPQDFGNPLGECVCTPKCGACADDQYPLQLDDPLLQTTGVRCFDVMDALLGVVSSADLVKGAGAIVQPKAKDNPAIASTAPVCALDEPVRSHKRGAHVYDASISTLPTSELILVDMRVESLKCRVPLPGTPQQVIYVPTSFHYQASEQQQNTGGGSPLSTQGMIVVIVLACVFVGVILFAIPMARFSRRRHVDVLTKEAELGVATYPNNDSHGIEMITNDNGHRNHLHHQQQQPLEESKREESEPSYEYQYGDPTFVIEDDAMLPMDSEGMSIRSGPPAADAETSASVHSGHLA